MTNSHWECTQCPWSGDEEVKICPSCGSAVTEIYDGPEEDDEEYIGVDG